MEAVSGSDVFLFPHLTPLLSNGDQTIAAVSLPTNKLYTINITAYNVYGHNSSTFTMSESIFNPVYVLFVFVCFLFRYI